MTEKEAACGSAIQLMATLMRDPTALPPPGPSATDCRCFDVYICMFSALIRPARLLWRGYRRSLCRAIEYYYAMNWHGAASSASTSAG